MALVRDYSKAQHAFQISGRELDEFSVIRFRGSEGLSQLYRFEVEMVATGETPLQFDDIVGKAAVLSIATPQGVRFFHGLVSRFEMTGNSNENLYFRAELVPMLWLLTHRYRSRIHQNKDVKEIITDVLNSASMPTDRFKFELSGTHAKREYCVQYRETDFNFICRLMEEEGIWYRFEQTKDAHTLIMADSKGAYKPITGEAKLPFVPASGMNIQDVDHVFRFRLGQAVRPSLVQLRDYNFKNPKLDLKTEADAGRDIGLEVYDYPGEYDSQAAGTGISKIRLEEFESLRKQGIGQSNCFRLSPGLTFELTEHTQGPLNATYLLTAIEHQGKEATTQAHTAVGVRSRVVDARVHQSLMQARQNDNVQIRELAEALLQVVARLQGGDPTAHRALNSWLLHAGQVQSDMAAAAAVSGGAMLDAVTIPNLIEDVSHSRMIDYDTPVYECRFECIPSDVEFRPPRITPWPVMRGTQTARVVGPKGEEIHTDEFGRVKVQFFWDTDGQMDDTASCFIRVCQGMAGGAYGMMFLPRIGQEVVVDFLEGNPDCPIIIGRVYNADHMPPYKLPDEKTKSVIKTHSSKGGGGNNEIRFEDLKDKEQLFIQAQRQMDMRVKGSHFHSVGGSYHLKVGGEKDGALSGEFRELVHLYKYVHVKGDMATQVDKGEQHNVDLDYCVNVKGTHMVTADKGLSIHSPKTTSVSGNGSLGLSGGEIKIEAQKTLELKCGGSSIVLTPGTIFIVGGPQVNINSGSGPAANVGDISAESATPPEDAVGADSSKPGKDVTYDPTQPEDLGSMPADIAGHDFPETPPPSPLPPPTIQAKWSKPKVTPNHNSAFPPATPPTDVIPEEAKVQMLVETTNVPDGTLANISIMHCHTGAAVHEGYVSNLIVTGNKVLDKKTSKPPEFVWEAKHHPWDPYDKPFFFFRVEVHYKSLAASTPKDYKTREAECLKVIYWHCCVGDAIADTPAGGNLTTVPEMNEIAGLMQAVPDTKVLSQTFNQNNVPVNLLGSVMRNTYCYHHAGHGHVVDRTNPATRIPTTPNPPTQARGNWRSVFFIGRSFFGDAEINNKTAMPSTPRYLAYIDTCVAGWEPSCANAFIGRGTRNVIAFRMFIPDGAARKMARDFQRKWANEKFNPEKIPTIFFDTGAEHYSSMRPVLFGQGGGAIPSPSTGALGAIGNALSSFAKGIGSLFH